MTGSVQEEATHTDRVRAFLEKHNERLGRNVEPGQNWVRVRPPSMEEAEQFAIDLRCVKFVRAGTLVTITAVDPGGEVHLSSFGDVMCFSGQEFRGTFMRLVDWSKPGASLPRNQF